MQCKICSSFCSSFEDTALKKTYFSCPQCEVIFLHPKFYLDNKNEKSNYNNHNNSIENEGYVKMFENFMDFFWDDLPTKQKLNALEFGCGPGPVLATLLERRGLHVSKFDPFFYPKALENNQKFSLITSTEVFEHLHNPMDVFSELKQRLSEDGVLALMTLFHQNNQKDFLNWWYRRDPTHIIFYTPKTFYFMARQHALTVKNCDNKRIITFIKK